MKLLILKEALLGLLFSPYCIHCERAVKYNELLCFECQSKLIRPKYFATSPNPIMDRLNLRVEIEHAAALYIFMKENPIQKLIHSLKYKSNYKVGVDFGINFGNVYNSATNISKAEYIIPIPIHRSRLVRRGYNQSEIFANGISQVTGITVCTKVLISKKAKATQTKKARKDRFENILNTFTVVNQKILENKRILLVDDVMTTGATIEAAVELLSSIKGIKIQIGLMALAEN